ncbi:MAG: ABC transporter transmembrane domain-containing protein, partial [Planctomycetota bacterium]
MMPASEERGFDRRRVVYLARVFSFVRRHQAWLWLSLVLLLVHAATRLAQPWLVKVAIDEHLTASGAGDAFSGLVAAFAGVAVLEWFCRHFQLRALERAGQGALLDLRKAVFAHLQKLPLGYFDRTPVGRLVGRATTAVES